MGSVEHLRGKGLQGGETSIPEDEGTSTSAGATAALVPNQAIVDQILQMGMSENAAKRACLAVQNAGAENAAEWYFNHMEDPDINDPPAAGGAGGAAAAGADPEAIMMLSSMGFSEPHAAAALKSCSNNTERAADWLFSHADDLDAAV